jgi:hypothetical protein
MACIAVLCCLCQLWFVAYLLMHRGSAALCRTADVFNRMLLLLIAGCWTQLVAVLAQQLLCWCRRQGRDSCRPVPRGQSKLKVSTNPYNCSSSSSMTLQELTALCCATALPSTLYSRCTVDTFLAPQAVQDTIRYSILYLRTCLAYELLLVSFAVVMHIVCLNLMQGLTCGGLCIKKYWWDTCTHMVFEYQALLLCMLLRLLMAVWTPCRLTALVRGAL